jgi:hypothetical protein
MLARPKQSHTMTKSDAQAKFDAEYISGSEIRRRLKVASCTLTLARQRGVLPEPIQVGEAMYVWVRSEVEPLLIAWSAALKLRRRELHA